MDYCRKVIDKQILIHPRHIWHQVTTIMTVVHTWYQVTQTTVVTIARSTDDPSDINDLDNDSTEVIHLGFPINQPELRKPLG